MYIKGGINTFAPLLQSQQAWLQKVLVQQLTTSETTV